MSTAEYPAGLLDSLAAVDDPELRAGVLDLFEHARTSLNAAVDAASRADLVVLSARRLACLYQLAVENGLTELDQDRPGTVVSDRYLDTVTDWSNIRHVLVLDDSVVLGTTLYGLVKKIRGKLTESGTGGTVRTAAVCVDTDQRAPYLLRDLDFTPLHERTSKEIEAFSRDVVMALFKGGVPFFSDFPTTIKFDVDTDVWDTYITDPNWHVADVTAPLLARTGRQALVQVPNAAAVESVLRKMLPPVATLVQNFKLRCYVDPPAPAHADVATDTDAGAAAQAEGAEDGVGGTANVAETVDRLTVRLVPIAMLSPASLDSLNDALGAICDALAPWDECPTDGWLDLEPVNKHRLVQMFASACLLPAAFTDEQFAATFGCHLNSKIWYETALKLYFGPQTPGVDAAFDRLTDQIRQLPRPHPMPPRPVTPPLSPRPSGLLRAPDVQSVLWRQRELIRHALPQEPAPGSVVQVGLMFAHSIFSVFGYINREYEVPQRAYIAGLGSTDAYEDEFGGDQGTRVLNQGLSMSELTDALLPQAKGGTSWEQATVSLGIDVGNDLGIVVPDTRYDAPRGVVYRCYRLGETAPLAANPLPLSARDLNWDPLTVELDTNYPLRPKLVTHGTRIDAPVPKAASNGASTDAYGVMATLSDEKSDYVSSVVLQRVPGEPRFKYEGVVDKVEATTFTATLTEWPNLSKRASVLRMDAVPDRDLDRVVAGAAFEWSVYETDDDARKVLSILRFGPAREVKAEQLGTGTSADSSTRARLGDKQ